MSNSMLQIQPSVLQTQMLREALENTRKQWSNDDAVIGGQRYAKKNLETTGNTVGAFNECNIYYELTAIRRC